MPDHGLHVGRVQEFHHLADAQLVEVDTRAISVLAFPAAYIEEGLHQLLEEGIGDQHLRRQIVGGLALGFSTRAERRP